MAFAQIQSAGIQQSGEATIKDEYSVVVSDVLKPGGMLLFHSDAIVTKAGSVIVNGVYMIDSILFDKDMDQVVHLTDQEYINPDVDILFVILRNALNDPDLVTTI